MNIGQKLKNTRLTSGLDNGKIKICGKDNKKSTNRISAMFEGNRNLYWRLTPRENLRYFAGIRGLGGKRLENERSVRAILN